MGEVEKLRHILINKSRDSALKKAHKFASCGQADDPCAMFDTQDGNKICFRIPRMIEKALGNKNLPERFDALFALTHGLTTFGFWIHDNECWEAGEAMEEATVELGKAWRDMLAFSDAELGIDAEFTRPGIEALLQK